ncbi:MAG: 16S rRNA processing protein RimM [Acidobacteriota bacterium]|nr:16S rRNA processing protein RimM [Acidobacteriota bacterium]
MSDWITVAILGKPRGNKGELTAELLTSGVERFSSLEQVSLSGVDYKLERVWNHEGTPVFKFEGVDSIPAAERLRGAEVRIPACERIELGPDEYFQSDLVGCEVRDFTTNRLIGTVTGWEDYGGPSLLQIDGGRLLIPFVKAICPEINPAARLIRVTLPEGLETLGSE